MVRLSTDKEGGAQLRSHDAQIKRSIAIEHGPGLLKRETGTGAMIDAVSIDAVNGCVRSSPAVDRMTIG